MLLREHDSRVLLWKASEMPHTVSAHGVHGDPGEENGRNLFTIDAMAPMVWQGLAVMPADAANHFVGSVEGDPLFVAGKKRSVAGAGTLSAVILKDVPVEWQTYTDNTVLVAQSPLLLPDAPAVGAAAEAELVDLAKEWARSQGLSAEVRGAWTNVGIRFGWNRHARARAALVAWPCRVL